MTALSAAPQAKILPDKAPRRWGTPVAYVVAVIVILLMLAPVLFIIIGGFRTNAQITADPAGWPSVWEIGNYLDVLGGASRTRPSLGWRRPRAW
jgi:raffinose/stachyose/melibiose transport system permease protein